MNLSAVVLVEGPMGTDAKCLVRVTGQQLSERMTVTPLSLPDEAFLESFPPEIRRALLTATSFEAVRIDDPEKSFVFDSFSDGIAVTFGPRFGDPEHELVKALAASLGSVLDLHDDPLGVFIYPDTAVSNAASYAEKIRELGRAGRYLSRDALKGEDLRPEAASARTLQEKWTALIADSCEQEGVDPNEVFRIAKGLRIRRP